MVTHHSRWCTWHEIKIIFFLFGACASSWRPWCLIILISIFYFNFFFFFFLLDLSLKVRAKYCFFHFIICSHNLSFYWMVIPGARGSRLNSLLSITILKTNLLYRRWIKVSISIIISCPWFVSCHHLCWF